MIAGVSGIYDEPELYELACAYRDIPAEADAIQAWCATHFAGQAGPRASAGGGTGTDRGSGVRSVL